MSNSVFESIRTAKYRIQSRYSDGEHATNAYAANMGEAKAKQDRFLTTMRRNGWGRVDGPDNRLYLGLKSVDVVIVDVETNKVV